LHFGPFFVAAGPRKPGPPSTGSYWSAASYCGIATHVPLCGVGQVPSSTKHGDVVPVMFGGDGAEREERIWQTQLKTNVKKNGDYRIEVVDANNFIAFSRDSKFHSYHLERFHNGSMCMSFNIHTVALDSRLLWVRGHLDEGGGAVW